jgi:transportin-3
VLFSRQLLTQICLALSALMLRAVENGKPIEQLFYSLQSLQSQDDGNIAVLEMLTVLPEEVFDNQNADSKISSACRTQYCQEVSFTDSFYLIVFPSYFLLVVPFAWP